MNIAIVDSTNGLMKNMPTDFPVYLTDTLIFRDDLEKKHGKNIFIVHTGHLLNPKASKIENEILLESLSARGIDLFNLTLEDFVIADLQGISFDKYSQNFLNSSVIDLSIDDLVSAKNIKALEIHNDVAFIGLSDTRIEKSVDSESVREKYIIDDYVLSILKNKRLTVATNPPIRSFIIIHTLGDVINDVMVRLPPNFINSLAD
jgi:hypothetical protein